MDSQATAAARGRSGAEPEVRRPEPGGMAARGRGAAEPEVRRPESGGMTPTRGIVRPGRSRHGRRPTMVDVARVAGVSLKTVSRVINNAPNVQPELIERVLAAVAELGFRRNDIARNLRSGQTTATIGLVIEEIANPFYSTIASAVAEVASQHETLLITASSEEDPEREEQLLRDLCARRVDGLIVVPAGFDHAYLRPEVEMGLGVVFLDRPAGGLLADTVLLDNRGGARSGSTRSGCTRCANGSTVPGRRWPAPGCRTTRRSSTTA